MQATNALNKSESNGEGATRANRHFQIMTTLKSRVLLVCIGTSVACGAAVAFLPFSPFLLGACVALVGSLAAYGVASFITTRIRSVRRAMWKDREVQYERHLSCAAGDELDWIDQWATEVIDHLRTARRELAEGRREVTDLVRVGEALNETRNRGHVVTRIIDESLKRLNAGSASILLFKEEEDALIVEATRGEGAPFQVGENVSSDHPMVARAFKERKPIIFGTGVRSRPGDSEYSQNGTAACVPLVVENKIIGLLTVSDKRGSAPFSAYDTDVLSFMANAASLVVENSTLQRQQTQVLLDMVSALATAVDQRDPYTRMHSRRVEEYSVAIARARRLEPEQMDDLQFGAILHDIGKIGIPDEVLLKPGRLTDREFEIIKSHPVKGATILAGIRLPWKILPIIRNHHERWAGNGYPDGLCGEEINYLTRIVTIADVFDAITSQRAYRDAMTLDEALAEMRRGVGVIFDPKLVPLSVEILRTEYPRVSEQFRG